MNKNYSKLNDLLFTPANKGYYHIPGISLKRLICTMYLDFELFDIHTKKLIHINIAYNVPEYLIFDSNLTNKKWKDFDKYVNKMFKKHEIDLSSVLNPDTKETNGLTVKILITYQIYHINYLIII